MWGIKIYKQICLSFLQRIQFIHSSEQLDIGLKANLLLFIIIIIIKFIIIIIISSSSSSSSSSIQSDTL